MFCKLFAERLVKTERFEAGLVFHAVDEQLARAIYDALHTYNLAEPFLSADSIVVPRQLSGSTDVTWSKAAGQVYIACNGGSLSAAQLFAIIERIAQLRLEPFGAVFAAALVQLAQRDGWPATLAVAADVPVQVSEEALKSWEEYQVESPESGALLKTALDSELSFTEPGDAFKLDSTHDQTFE